eukprot:CAMPEP_0206042524 /NCGR_PEP_ID=MMETSP1466-20131121/6607_1 /ASSEMBLY_ACC=CAM_ASM_001126 /TAXON_ID=44452 /ORGANISM="Pavlova gyrans, Strain CCMP608" /LENGTH=264 /DNA_ID=CAMNT_0053417235 /DNA_START=57 /DNA_END=851 /DNA_ORIENTATION=+
MYASLILGLLASLDERSISDRMAEPRSTVSLLSNPSRSVTSDGPNNGGLSWNAFRGSFRQNLGDAQVGVTLDKQKHNDFFNTAGLAKRIIDSDLKLDAQVVHDFADSSTRLEASLLTKDGTRISGDVDRNLKLGRIELSKSLSDLPLSRQLGNRLTLTPSLAVGSRELTLEAQQDIGSKNVVIPSATLNSDGSLNRWGVGWMSRLNNGDAVHAQVDPQDQKLDVRYDRACDDGSQWRVNANVPSIGSDNVLGNTAWSVTRVWTK